jgi:sugar phosphate isomerase/epimerase
MRVGMCASMIAPERDGIGIDAAGLVATIGFDYIELSLAHMAALEEAEFRVVAARLDRAGISCEACNNFFPPRVRLTGANADLASALAYATGALTRAARLGVEVVVLGSSGAKNVPDGFPLAAARRQLLALLRGLAPLAERNGITIVVEPISRPEANFVNLAAEGLELVREVDHSSIRLLVDYYHLAAEAEDPEIIRTAGPALRHVHFATPGSRGFPLQWDDRWGPCFAALGDIDYGGRLSIEAFTSDLVADGPRALEVIRAASARLPRC